MGTKWIKVIEFVCHCQASRMDLYYDLNLVSTTYGQNKFPLYSTCNYYKTFKFCKRIGNLLVQNWHTPHVVCF
jgi:hypothetical protein